MLHINGAKPGVEISVTDVAAESGGRVAGSNAPRLEHLSLCQSVPDHSTEVGN